MSKQFLASVVMKAVHFKMSFQNLIIAFYEGREVWINK